MRDAKIRRIEISVTKYLKSRNVDLCFYIVANPTDITMMLTHRPIDLVCLRYDSLNVRMTRGVTLHGFDSHYQEQVALFVGDYFRNEINNIDLTQIVCEKRNLTTPCGMLRAGLSAPNQIIK